MRFSRVYLKNWRNFGEVDVPVANRVFLVGANATGKSNFLDALRFLQELVSTGGGFRAAVLKRGGVKKLRNLAARRETDVIIEVDLGSGGNQAWRYRIVFNQDNLSRPILREEKVWDADNSLVLDRPDSEDTGDPERLRQTHLEQVFANREFREIANFFRSIKYSHIIPQLVREPDRATKLADDPFGSDFLEQIATADKRNQGANLRRIEEAIRKVVQQLSDLQLWRDSRGLPHLRVKYKHWRVAGAWQDETDLSDGTLRLIGFLWALQEGRGPLLLEEPELSLHPGLVRLLPQVMRGLQRARHKPHRQVFLSTHSRDLLWDEGIGADEVLLLTSRQDGSTLITRASREDIAEELEAGLNMADVVLPRTRPPDLEQMLLWK